MRCHRVLATGVGIITAMSLAVLVAPVAAHNGGGHGGHGGHPGAGPGAVYTATNGMDGNRVLVFDRKGNGTLELSGNFPTGGFGTGAGLGNQGGVSLSNSGRWLFVVNAGSDELSVFSVWPRFLILTDIVPSGGAQPISVTSDHDLVYVLNAGDGGNITGFTLDWDGRLTPLAGSTQPLSGAPDPGPAQVQFTPDGQFLVVTEKNTNQIDVFPVDGSGLAGPAVVNASEGETPFGFAVDPNGTLVVSEAFGGAADASALSSYSIAADGTLDVISPSVATTETAACWVVITYNGRLAYTTNTGSGSVSGYSIQNDGALALLTPDGRTGVTGDGSMPIDAALSRGSHFLYTLNTGTNEISVFRVRPHNGGLTLIQTVMDLPPGANGLAAR